MARFRSVPARSGRASVRRGFRRSVVPVVAALAVIGLVACDPPPAPDGRDLGLVLDAAAPVLVRKGDVVELSGSITNHGTAPATGVTFDYGVAGGFSVDAVDLGDAGSCSVIDAAYVSCSLTSALEPGANVAFSASATAGEVSGGFAHILGATSDGTEPTPDPNPGHLVFPVEVRPGPAAPTSVDLGNGTNYLGTGRLLGAAGAPGHPDEGLFLSVNPYCTDKVNGDRYQSGYSGSTCSGTVNSEFRPEGYTYAIDVPEGRTTPIDVLLYDARYNASAIPAGDGVTSCSWQWPTTWIEVSNTGSRTFTVADQTQYQRRQGTGSNGSSWLSTTLLPAGTHSVEDGYRYRYRTWSEVCTTTPVMESAVDNYRQNGPETTTFSFFAADATPGDPGDNPMLCTQAFDKDTPFDAGPFLGSYRWNRLCQIDPSMPAGRYLLRVRNGGAITAPEGDGSNQFGIVAAPAGAAAPGELLCDSSDPGCPEVSGPGEASIRVDFNANVARVGLGSVGVEHEGRELRLDLYDPGEGGRVIRILRPTGPGTWAPATVTWSSPGVAGSPGSGTSIPVRGAGAGTDLFNGRVLSISVDLAGYMPPAGNDDWLLEYEFADAVTDRTTWNAVIADRPA